MTNTEIMRKFFLDLPDVMFAECNITQKQFDSLSKEQMINFIDGLRLDYPTKELQDKFEETKVMWKMYYEMPSGLNIHFLDY